MTILARQNSSPLSHTGFAPSEAYLAHNQKRDHHREDRESHGGQQCALKTSDQGRRSAWTSTTRAQRHCTCAGDRYEDCHSKR